jgi:hypothetical protein
MWSRRRSQHRDHGEPYVRTNFGTVNSTAQKARNGAVLAHGKFGFNPLLKVQSTQTGNISLLSRGMYEVGMALCFTAP